MSDFHIIGTQGAGTVRERVAVAWRKGNYVFHVWLFVTGELAGAVTQNVIYRNGYPRSTRTTMLRADAKVHQAEVQAARDALKVLLPDYRAEMEKSDERVRQMRRKELIADRCRKGSSGILLLLRAVVEAGEPAEMAEVQGRALALLNELEAP